MKIDLLARTVLLSCLGLLANSAEAAQAAGTRPNILFIMADEESMRMPLLVRYPRAIKAGSSAAPAQRSSPA